MEERLMRARSDALVIALVGKELSEKWWNSFNKSFNMTPEEKWKVDPSQVYSYLMGHSEGQW